MIAAFTETETAVRMHATARPMGSPSSAFSEATTTSIFERLGAVRGVGRRETATFSILLVLWALCNPFYGIDASNLVYLGRALADLDPGGVGRDAMFVHDGQSGFTVFTPLFRRLAQTTGLSSAAALVAACAIASAFLGAAVLACALAKGPSRWLIIAFAAALPAQYGGYKLFAYAETAATPRPFAEALVLCGIAALLHRKHVAAIALMSFAVLTHPIMGASGVALLAAWLVVEDRRWLVPLGLAAAGIVCLAMAGVAPFNRLAIVIDPDWAAIVRDRSPQLYPSLWLDGWTGRLVVRIATLLIAARAAPPRVRRLFLLVIVIGLAGLAGAYGLGERANSLLVLQAQTWRMMWIVFALATAAAALATVDLWRRGGTSRVALGILAMAWAFRRLRRRGEPARYRRARRRLFDRSAALRACRPVARSSFRWADSLGRLRPRADRSPIRWSSGPAGSIRQANASGFDYTPVAFLAAAAALAGYPRLGTGAIAAFTAIGAVLVGLIWDQRSATNAFYDFGPGVPDLVQQLAERPGEVYWIDGGRQTWWWLNRPQWLAPIQGAGIVFSRDLAMTYKARAARAIEAGLGDRALLAPLLLPRDASPQLISAASLATFCAASDAPAWIIAPLEGPRVLPDDVARTEWTAPIVEMQLARGNAWRPISHFAIVPCAARPTHKS